MKVRSNLNFAFSSAAYFNDHSQTFSFIISHNDAGLTASSLFYSARTSWIALVLG